MKQHPNTLVNQGATTERRKKTCLRITRQVYALPSAAKSYPFPLSLVYYLAKPVGSLRKPWLKRVQIHTRIRVTWFPRPSSFTTSSMSSSSSSSDESDTTQLDPQLNPRRKLLQEDDDQDVQLLAKLGYSQTLYRGFTGPMTFSFSFTAVAVVASITGLFPTAMAYGGPVVLIWSWIGVSCLTMIVCLNMAEICSTYPCAGSVYYWSGCLAGPKYGPLAAYVTGWFNLIGNAAGDAFYAYTFSSFLASLLVTLGHPAFSVHAHVVVSIVACAVWAVQNLMRMDYQGYLNNFSAIWQVLSSFAIVISLFATCPSSGNPMASTHDVFFTYYNGTSIKSDTYLALVGLLTALYSFTGYEAAGHVSEEAHHAQKSAPHGIVWTGIATFAVGLFYILGLLYATANQVESIVTNGYGVMDVIKMCSTYNTTAILGSILLLNIYFAGNSSFTVTSRITYAMARDKAFPGSSWVAKILPSTQAPIGAVILVFLIDVVLIMLNLVNETAFIAVTGVATIGYQISYAIPILLRITRARHTFAMTSAFNLGHRWVGNLLGCISVTFLTFTSVLFFLPTEYPVTADNMNYACFVVGGVAMLGGGFWIASARYWFTGPSQFPC